MPSTSASTTKETTQLATPAKIEHGWFDNTPTADGRGVNIGDELWGFIPQELLPHLRWLADPSYTHVYYVDLKPKVTDVRIFPNDADHPGGWGTILIGGFRMGGSCGNLYDARSEDDICGRF